MVFRRNPIKLRIVTWNCNMALRLKFDRLLSLRPDVAVIQECADPAGAKSWQPDCTACDWIGFNTDKGLGIFTFGGLTLTRHASHSETYALYLPVTVSGWCHFNLLGLWAADPRTAPAGATSDPATALQYYRSFLAAGPAVVAGDFNRLPQQMSVRHSGPGSSMVDLLAGAGLTNADFAMSDASGQPALRRTHFHQRKFSRGFVVDYIFIPATEAARLTAFEVGDPHDWITWSDHVLLIAEFDLTPGSAFGDNFRKDRTVVI
jgi:exodeoxyribonuclease III